MRRALRALTRPWRVARARARTLRDRRRHAVEVARGSRLGARADRTPVFVLGAPRSGTTLLYQLLIEGLDVGWLANAHAEAPSEVSGVERRDRPRAARAHSDWESRHGATREPWGPSECGPFWYRAFPRDRHEMTDADATPRRTHDLRAMVREFADACGAPVVFKNVFNTLRVPVIAAALPEARYVLIERDLEANARSLLAGRASRGRLDAWWSAVPDGAAALDAATPGEQVVWQVSRLNSVVRRELGRLPDDHVLTVGYDELCRDPRDVLRRVHEWLAASGAVVELRADARLPEQFEQRAGGTLAPELEADLRAALAAHAGAPGSAPR